MAAPQNRNAGGVIMIEFEKPFFLLCLIAILPACAVTLYRIKKLKESYAAAGEIHAIVPKYCRSRTALGHKTNHRS